MLHQESLINYEVYLGDNAERLLGTASAEFGDLEFLSSEIKGAGIGGSYENPVVGHIKAPEVTLNWRTLFTEPVRLLSPNARKLSLRAAIQRYDSGNGTLKILPVKIDVRARMKSSSLGKFEPGEQTETKTVLICDYLKITIDNVERFEYDCFNFIYKVYGDDLLADVRTALGL